MHNELTNLLPSARRNILSRDYFLRFGVVVVVFVMILALAAILLLLPTYVFLSESARAKEAHLAAIDSTLSSVSGTSLPARLATLSRNVAALSALAHTPSVNAIVRSALGISRPGVSLSGFIYTSVNGPHAGTLAITGSALTRDALRGYQLALSSAPFAQSADLPVSAYAKDSDISFTITVTLAP